jgi:hypothetical protein
MARCGSLSKLKSTFFVTAVFALFSFSFQSNALPIHSVAHATHHAFQAAATSSSPHIVESDCALCGFSIHQAIQSPMILPFDTAEVIALRSEIARVENHVLQPALLPPVRGPPARA